MVNNKNMKYQVFDNNKPADYKHCKVHNSWSNSKFHTFGAAFEYACKWLGNHNKILIDLYDEDNKTQSEYVSLINVPIDYSGYGDTIEIREVKD